MGMVCAQVFPWLQAGTEEHATLSVGDACARLTADAENDHVLRVEMRQGAALLVPWPGWFCEGARG